MDSRSFEKFLKQFTDRFTPELAEHFATLPSDTGFSPPRQLGRKPDGTLTDKERSEYATYVEAMDVVALLRVKALAAFQEGAYRLVINDKTALLVSTQRNRCEYRTVCSAPLVSGRRPLSVAGAGDRLGGLDFRRLRRADLQHHPRRHAPQRMLHVHAARRCDSAGSTTATVLLGAFWPAGLGSASSSACSPIVGDANRSWWPPFSSTRSSPDHLLRHGRLASGVLRFFVAMRIGSEWAVAAPWWRRFSATSPAHASGIFHATSCLGTMDGVARGPCRRRPVAVAYLVSVVPALLVVWVWSSVKEPESWIAARDHAAAGTGGRLGSLRELFLAPALGPRAVLGTLLAAVGLGTFWSVTVAGQGIVQAFLHQQGFSDAVADGPPGKVRLRTPWKRPAWG